MSEPCSVTNVASLAPTLLPSSPTAAATLDNPSSIVALIVHTLQTCLEFKLVIDPTPSHDPTRLADSSASEPTIETANDTQDEDDDGDAVSETDTAVEEQDRQVTSLAATSSSSTVPREILENNKLGSDWKRAADYYSFEYTHHQSSLRFTITVAKMGARVNITGMAQDDSPHQVSILSSDLVNVDRLPWPRADDPESRGAGILRVVTSESKFKDFVEQYKRDIVARVLPGLHLPGYSEPPPNGTDEPRRPPRGGVFPEPNAHPTPRSDNRPYNPSVGHRDLDPTAAFQPPGFARPGSGGLGQGNDGGGMYVDFNHPMFQGRRDGDDPDRFGGGVGSSMCPPGARWDPVGPGFPTGPRGGGGGGGPFRGGGPGLAGDSDFDELLPPGENGPDLNPMGSRGGLGGPRGGGGFGGGMSGGFGGGMGGGFGGGGGGFGGGGMFM